MYYCQKQPKFEIVKVLGKGSFGYVFEAINTADHQKYAIKRVSRKGKTMSMEHQHFLKLKNQSHIV